MKPYTYLAVSVCLAALALLFLILYLRERSRSRKYRPELDYICKRIHEIQTSPGSGYLLIPSENPGIAALAAELNRLLDVFYQERAEGRRARQSMAQMLTNISHDLRTPLTVLSGYAELLAKTADNGTAPPAITADGGLDDDKSGDFADGGTAPPAISADSGTHNGTDPREMIARIRQKTDELVRTIDAYFTLSKSESGDMQIKIRPTDLTALCHGLLLDYYDILEDASFVVDAAIEDAPACANTDPDALRRILKNLIDNAIRHGGAGRYLGFRLDARPEHVTIAVEDHGPGIPEKDQEQIFSRNYSTAHRASGSGLGLAIARNLAVQIHADLRVMSRPGKTVFTLRL